MGYFRFFRIAAAGVVFVVTGCASDLTCDDPQPYQSAVETGKVATADGLNELASTDEMTIPRASPRDPRSPGDPCLDLPPTIQATSDDE